MTIMGCGHAPNAINQRTGEYVCAICVGLTEGADVQLAEPDLEGRTANCAYGKHGFMPSSTDLVFFEYRPTKETDKYYCGCFGWD